jgi:hypothetical protein
MEVTLSGMVIFVKLLQLLNRPSEMTMRLLGMFIDVKFVQPENAEVLMEVTLSGMVIFVKLEQS